MKHSRPIAFLTMLSGAAILPAPAFAQDYLGSFLQSRQDANIREIQQGAPVKGSGPQAAPHAQPTPETGRTMAQLRAQLRPEYERRVRLYGKPAADSWLRQEAAKAGRLQAEQLNSTRAP